MICFTEVCIHNSKADRLRFKREVIFEKIKNLQKGIHLQHYTLKQLRATNKKLTEMNLQKSMMILIKVMLKLKIQKTKNYDANRF